MDRWVTYDNSCTYHIGFLCPCRNEFLTNFEFRKETVYGAEIKVEKILSVDFVFCKIFIRNWKEDDIIQVYPIPPSVGEHHACLENWLKLAQPNLLSKTSITDSSKLFSFRKSITSSLVDSLDRWSAIPDWIHTRIWIARRKERLVYKQPTTDHNSALSNRAVKL